MLLSIVASSSSETRYGNYSISMQAASVVDMHVG